MKRLGLVCAALLLVSACGGGSGGDTKQPAKPKTFDVSGTMSLTTSQGVIELDDNVCGGSDGYDDIRGGASVVVFDSSGKKVGIGELGDGTPGAYARVQCNFEFTVEDVPDEGDGIYSVEVANRGEVSFKRADAQSVALSLGN